MNESGTVIAAPAISAVPVASSTEGSPRASDASDGSRGFDIEALSVSDAETSFDDAGVAPSEATVSRSLDDFDCHEVAWKAVRALRGAAIGASDVHGGSGDTLASLTTDVVVVILAADVCRLLGLIGSAVETLIA